MTLRIVQTYTYYITLSPHDYYNQGYHCAIALKCHK